MNHDAANGKLLELAWGELAPREARAVEAHVAACDGCREELARIRETRALMAQLPAEPPPERGEAIVMAAARQAAAARRPKPLLPPWLWAGAAGAMAAAFVAVVSWQLRTAEPAGPLAERESDLLGRAPQQAPATPERTQAGPAVAAGGAPVVRKELAAEAPRGADSSAPSKRKGDVAKRPPAEPLGALSEPRVCERMQEPGGGWQPAGVPEGARAFGGGSAAPAAPPPPPAPAPVARAAPRAPAMAMDEAERFAEPPASASAPARAEPAPAPPPAAPQKARAPAVAERKAAAPAAVRAFAADVAPGSVETRSFPDCPGERRRVVERDAEGRIVRYLREGERATIEQRYGPDGRLISAIALEGGTRRPLPLDAPGLVRLARDAGIDVPPRCTP